jgi:hypothetical protein
MPARTPPQWFQRRLKAFDRRLDCRWSDAHGHWVIAERVPRVVFVGTAEGMTLHKMEPRYDRVFYVLELGTQIIDWLRRNDMKRFASVESMVQALEIDSNEAVTA